ncbi:MAG TPA: ATP-dependent DNA helicase RecG [Anaerolineaceae bacterium]|nr:ATP-dependent DNA helicase RecG [Anaerolineaceae bacterium]
MLSAIEKLLKFMRLEVDRGYDNRAVVGGLNKVLPWWEPEARASGMDAGLLERVVEQLNAYPGYSLEDRAACLNDLLNELEAALPAETERRTATPPHPRPVDSDAQSAPSERSRRPAVEREPSAPIGLDAPVTVLPGVGPKYAQTMKQLGLNTLADLLYYFPRRYDDYSQLKTINRLEYGEELTIIATVQSVATRPLRGGQSSMIEAVVSDGTGSIRITWFNQPWIANRLNRNDQIAISGKVDMYLGRLVMNSPDWEPIEQNSLNTNRIVPVYPLTAHVTQKWLRRLMYDTVTYWAARITDYLPEDIRRAVDLPPLGPALVQAHFPDSMERLRAARARLAFDEILLLQLGVLQQKSNWQSVAARVFETPDAWLDAQVQRLPYPLTGAQQRALAHVRADLSSGRPMNRLLQGDVGSGKTVIAALGAAMVTRAGAQAAIMAPTSILAEQHYRNLTRMLTEPGDNDNAALKPEEIRLLVGDTPEAEKAEIRTGLEEGNIKLIIGTHALIEAPISFNQLEFVVIDEQHRFGVAQRAALRVKGQTPHLLVMTATPIPRSLALTLYGDLDLTVMDEMPAGRQPVETHVLHPLERERAYQLIRTQVQQGRQAFIIYPLIEKGDKEESKAAVDEHERLQSVIFPRLKLGLLHGRMRPDEKEQVMARFRDGEFQILVSTTVVEVGVDVPNATVMLIEGANRFGLAQLHQLRGRVGRGGDQAYCLLIPENENAIENERLAVMAETNDGFVLAERDLDQRGPGDFLGTRQAGFAQLRMASLTDVRLIEKAREQAMKINDRDPDLSAPENAALRRTLQRFWNPGKGDIS